MIFALLACASRVPVGDGMTGDVPEPQDYGAAVRDATRELRVYEQMSTAMLLRAAWLDADFRRAQEAMRAHLLLLEPPLREAHLAASLAEAESGYTFVFSADSQWREELSFAFDESAPWRLRLFAGGAPCTPETLDELKPTPIDNRLYPFHNSWSGLWKARFSADCGRGTPLILQVTGPRGAGELGWRTSSTG